MSIDSNIPILIALVSLVFIIGIILGVIFGQLFGRSRKAQAAEGNNGAVKARMRFQEILRLARDPDTGRVITEFQGRAIRDPHTISQSDRDYLVRLARDWATWLGISEPQLATKVEAGPAAPINQSAPANPAAPAGLAADPASVAAAVAVAGAQANVPVLPLAPVKPVVTPLPAPPTPRSIVQQVDDILQEKLAAHPMPVPTIRLVDDLHAGVIVWVNGDKYEGIESVSDPEVRTIIRSAVVEWEHRTEK